jgi:hypothetical protein
MGAQGQTTGGDPEIIEDEASASSAKVRLGRLNTLKRVRLSQPAAKILSQIEIPIFRSADEFPQDG